jgi:hypothetical protein
MATLPVAMPTPTDAQLAEALKLFLDTTARVARHNVEIANGEAWIAISSQQIALEIRNRTDNDWLSAISDNRLTDAGISILYLEILSVCNRYRDLIGDAALSVTQDEATIELVNTAHPYEMQRPLTGDDLDVVKGSIEKLLDKLPR